MPASPRRGAAHAEAVAASLARQLSSLRHWNGAPVCVLYGARGRLLQEQGREQQQQEHGTRSRSLPRRPGGVAGQGPVVAFNLLRADGSPVGHREMEKLASLSGILLRTGCCCNPGACAAAVGLSSAGGAAPAAAA